jgi:diguanylate cyclase (GGDEF)-like protein/PAS domain S-box-containing protein
MLTNGAAAARLLIVDDNEFNTDFLTRRLQRQGYNVTNVKDGKSALDLVRRGEVDIMLLDIEMPVLSGLNVLQEVRQQHTPSELPIIMITAQHESSVAVEAFELGANDYVTKPIDFAVVNARIRTQLAVKLAEDARRDGEERFMLAVTGSKDGIWDWDLRTDSIFFSGRWKSMLGYEEDEIGSTPDEWLKRIHPEDLAQVQSSISAHLEGLDPHFESEHRVLHRDGTYRWMLSRALAIRDAQGKAYRMAGSQADITTVKVTDTLTGLPNRALFLDRLTCLYGRATRQKDLKFAILFLDVDRFKVVNDSLGHLVGDQLLIAFSQRLQQSLRSTDAITRLHVTHTLARLGGDEFTVVLDDLENEADAVAVAERVMRGLREPFNIGGNELYVGVSIGVALNTTGGENPEDLLANADIAMYCAKNDGRNRIQLYGPEMRASAMARMQLETEMRRGIERGEFQNWYQLIVDLDTGEINGLEALLRWNHPTRGMIQPTEFIPVAEETGLIIPIGTAVLREACRDLWCLQQVYPSPTPLSISVNLSCRQFTQPDLVEQIESILLETGLAATSLKLEITETMVMDDPEAAKTMLRRLKALGVKLEIDDFGTGYSSLSYLRSYPLDTLKIDRSFISDMENDTEKAEITRTITTLAQNLGLEVIAEGIESEEQRVFLKKMGCKYGQGYYFCRPLDAAAARDLLAAQSHRLTSSTA